MKPVRRTRKRKGQDGIAVMLTAILLLLIIPAVGLAIDSGVLYVIKTQMAAASDAAALAAARSLNLGQTVPEQDAIAVARARSFFLTNFPNGYMATSNSQINTTLTYLNYATLQVKVETSVDAPFYFMRMLRSGNVTVRAMGTATRRNVNLMLVLDKSGSMAATACDAMKSAATTFVGYFAAGRDKLGLISFNGAYNLELAPTANFSSPIKSKINALSCAGSTGTAQAINQAYGQLTALAEPLSLNVMVFFTDGQPTALTADFPLKMRTDTRYGNNYGSHVSTYFPGGCNSTNSTCSMEPSTCKDGNGNSFDRNSGAGSRQYNGPNWNPNWFGQGAGGLAVLPTYRGYLADYNSAANVGATAGLQSWNPSEGPVSDATGCAFKAGDIYDVRRDIAYIPATDMYGNSTVGYKTNYRLSTNAYTGNDYFGGGEYAGKLRPDMPAAITNASFNAADDQGRRVRTDATYNIVIYCVGLGGQGGYPPDTEFMTRLANHGSATDSYSADTDRPRGLYIYSPNTTELNQAFAVIASSVLRLSQ